MNKNLFQCIGDLIEVPVLRTVVELAETRDLDPDDPQERINLELLAANFVLTEDTHKILSIILNKISKNEGRGFLISGNYGSGKSYLLSILSLLTQHNWAWTNTFSDSPDIGPLKSHFIQSRYLPVMIPLTEYSSDLSLEEIVWNAIEVSAAIEGIPLALSTTERYINLFEKYIRPVHNNDFIHFLSTQLGTEYPWERIRRDDPPAAHTLIAQFINNKEITFPIKISSDRKQIMTSLIQSIKMSEWNGLLIIIDELSEFLKAKSDPRALNEDARFLQFLGEFSNHHPIWITGTLQESLERSGDLREAVFKKIKDRYIHNLRLTTQHIKELIRNSLIKRKSPEAEKYIHMVYERYQRAFSRFSMSASDFIEIYPVHPETLDLLDKNSDLFSRRRGIVDFLTARISGRPEQRINGILDSPPHHLLTPDYIFDHFEDRLAESAEFTTYFRLYREHFSPRIQTVFTESNKRKTADKIIKILILLAICPFEEQRTLKDIANSVLFQALDSKLPAGDMNYQFLHEQIMRRLYKDVGHIKIQSGQTFLDDIYSIDIKSDISEVIEFRIRRLISDTSAMNFEVVKSCFTQLSYSLFPISFFLNRPVIRESILWQNTHRNIQVWLGHLGNLDPDHFNELKSDLLCGHIDAAIFFAWFGDIPKQISIAQKLLAKSDRTISRSVAIIIPRIPDNPSSLQPLKEVYACRKIMKEYSEKSTDESEEILSLLKERLDQRLHDTHKLMLKSYGHGDLISVTGRKKMIPVKNSEDFDDWVQLIVEPILTNRFPDHYMIAPKREIGSRILMESIIEKFVIPGEASLTDPKRNETILQAVKSIAIPLGIAKQNPDKILLTISPRKSPASAAIIDCLPPDQGLELPLSDKIVPYSQLKHQIITSKLGITPLLFELLLLALMKKGYIQLYFKDQLLILEHLRLPLKKQVTHVSRGELLPIQFRPALNRLNKILTNRNLKDLDLDIQQEIWQKTQKYMEKWDSELNLFIENLEILQIKYASDQFESKQTDKLLMQINQYKKMINEHTDAHTGLKRFLTDTSHCEKFEHFHDQIKHVSAFRQVSLEPYVKARDYLADSDLLLPESVHDKQIKVLYRDAVNKQNLSDELIYGDSCRDFLQAFESFQQSYIDWYKMNHENFQKKITAFESDQVTKSVEFRVLEKISVFRNLNMIESLDKAIHMMKRVAELTCHRPIGIELKNRPICSCGYRKVNENQYVLPSDIVDFISNSITHFLIIFQNPGIQKKLHEKENQLTSEEKKAVHSIQKLNVNDRQIAVKLDALIEIELMRKLNMLLSQSILIKKRNLKHLNRKLQNRKLTKKQLLDVFTDWIGHDLSDDDVIQLDE